MKLKFIEERKAKKQAEIDAVNVESLSRPVNDVQTSGPKKMKDFSPWAFWKSALVGVGGVVFVFLCWQLYATLCEMNQQTSFLSSPLNVFQAIGSMATTSLKKGDAPLLFMHMGFTFSRVMVGYCIALVCAIPVAFLMAWYKPVRSFIDPFIQFLRCIPPIAYVPLVVAGMGVGEPAKYFIIFLACFLTMTVTIYQGVRNVDLTLVKAAYTFGARDKNLFMDVIVPSAFPFILTAMRLGIGAALTTVVAAELTGTNYGLGALVSNQAANLQFDYAIAGILILGVFGILLDKLLLFAEKKLTRWK